MKVKNEFKKNNKCNKNKTIKTKNKCNVSKRQKQSN